MAPGRKVIPMKSRTFPFIAAAIMVGLLMLPAPRANAQSDPPAGVTVETLSSLPIPVDREATLQQLRFTFNPGTGVVMYHHSGPVIVTVLSGELTTSVADPDALLVRSDSIASLSVVPGKRYILEPGDKITYDAATTGDVLQDNGTSFLMLTAMVLEPEGQSNIAFLPAASLLFPTGPCISCH